MSAYNNFLISLGLIYIIQFLWHPKIDENVKLF